MSGETVRGHVYDDGKRLRRGDGHYRERIDITREDGSTETRFTTIKDHPVNMAEYRETGRGRLPDGRWVVRKEGLSDAERAGLEQELDTARRGGIADLGRFGAPARTDPMEAAKAAAIEHYIGKGARENYAAALTKDRLAAYCASHADIFAERGMKMPDVHGHFARHGGKKAR